VTLVTMIVAGWAPQPAAIVPVAVAPGDQDGLCRSQRSRRREPGTQARHDRVWSPL